MAKILLTEDGVIKIQHIRRQGNQPQQKPIWGRRERPIATRNLKNFTGTLKAFKRKN